ncbi:MAG: C69 family dipeptidase [Treponema sp.]
MNATNHHACTSILVGKKASVDGSVIIARNEDFHEAISVKLFTVQPASEVQNRVYTSKNTGVTVALPPNAMRCTFVPQAFPLLKGAEGEYGEASINERNVAVSATESVYGNPRVLAYDPLVPEGIAEDAINHIVAPFITSAREGVTFLGKLIAQYGSAEGNGILFADAEEAWYMEIPCGHYWVAERIPDDCYAVAPNQVSIEHIDFGNAHDFMWAEGIQAFVDAHNLNPDREGFNFRHIFGTSTEKDRVYNTPRAWFAQKYLNPEIEQSPVSNDIPFIRKANRLISVEDVQYLLSSHYNETVYDPIGTSGNAYEKTRFRAISLSRTAESHILQLRSGIPEGLVGVQWLAFGTTAFTPYVPFFTNVTDTPKIYKKKSATVSFDNAYWLFKILGYLTESHYTEFHEANTAYLYEMQTYGFKRLHDITEAGKSLSGDQLTCFLTTENEKTADYIIKKTKELITHLMMESFKYSQLSFTMDKNL